jgi:hypothetical protein
MLLYAVPPGYWRQQPACRTKLDAWVGAIEQILEEALLFFAILRSTCRSKPEPAHRVKVFFKV